MIISYTLLMLGRRLIGRRFAGDEPSLFFFCNGYEFGFFPFFGEVRVVWRVIKQYCVVPFYFVW